MRFITFLAASAFLAACATAPPSATSPPPVSAVPGAAAAATAQAARLLAAAGQTNAPTQSEIERAFGAPDIMRRDGAGAALTYRLDSCALLLVFTADTGNAMRLAEAHRSARRAGEGAPSVDQCAAEAAARR